MNYWHIQLHPNDRTNFPDTRIREILEQKSIIGLGEWEDGEQTRNQFTTRMAIGDIVAVKQGSTPIALVRVCGEVYFERIIDNNFDWFPNRRKVEILDFYKNEYDFNIPQPRGTLSICDNLHTETSKVIIKWYKKVLRKTLMDSIKLSSERQSEIKNMWINFKDSYNFKGLEWAKNEALKLSAEWQQYKTKIEDNSLSIEEYTNRKEAVTATMPGSYLCNFLERDTKTVFGSSKPGNSNNFEIKLNSDGTTYTIRTELKQGDKGENKNDLDKSLLYFNNQVKPILKKIVKTQDSREKVDAVENSNYAAKQILRKMAVLDKTGEFLFIYSDNIIDVLHAEFVGSDEATNLGKNHEIRLVANEILDLNKDDVVESILLSWFLWRYANTQSIADENTPNVILYGPPGTGKTYAVKQSLDFICQGDRSRYEFVQFHPSFTYEDFIEGIKPKGVTPDGNIKFELVDGIFKRFCKRAKANPDKKYYFVVDEINRANLSSVFGETLLCLEKDYRHDVQNNNDENLFKTQYSTLIEEMIKEDPSKVDLAYHYKDGNAYFGVPNNVFFIGMMNDVDKSIDAFDLALRRRFKWIRKDCDYEVVEETKFKNGEEFTNITTYVKACRSLNDYINKDLGLGKSYEFGHSFFMKMTAMANRKEITIKNLETLFQLHMSPTLKEYLRAMFAESELDNKLEKALGEFTKPFKAKA